MGPSARSERPRPKLDAFGEDFAAFHARFASLFVRSEPRRKAVPYLRTLMGPVERRNGSPMAEAMGDATPTLSSACSTTRRGAPAKRGTG